MPHIRPARENPAGGKLDQRCFCAVLLQSNRILDFWLLSSVARKAFAAATIAGVASCDVLDVVGTPSADVVADGVVAPAVASSVGAAPVAGVDAAVVGSSALVGSAVGCCTADGTAVAVALADPHAFRSAAPADTPVRANACFRNALRVVP